MQDGLYENKQGDRVSNVIPKLVRIKIIKNSEKYSGSVYLGIKFYKSGKLDDAIYWYRFEDIETGKFMHILPKFANIEPRYRKIAEHLFQWYIRIEMRHLRIEETILKIGDYQRRYMHDSKKMFEKEKIKGIDRSLRRFQIARYQRKYSGRLNLLNVESRLFSDFGFLPINCRGKPQSCYNSNDIIMVFSHKKF